MRQNGTYEIYSVHGKYVTTLKGQAEVASYLHVTQGAISQIMTGKLKQVKGHTIRRVDNGQ